MEDFVDSQIDVDCMDYNDLFDYNKRCFEYVIEQINWYLENPDRTGITKRDKVSNKLYITQGNLIKLLKYLKALLKNPEDQNKIIYRK